MLNWGMDKVKIVCVENLGCPFFSLERNVILGFCANHHSGTTTMHEGGHRQHFS